MQWTQAYTPIGGNLLLSALAALVPIIFFFWALAIKRMKGYTAGLATLGIALIIAVLVYRMPAEKALMSATQGAVYGLLPIGWIIVTSVFLYKITVKTGQFDIIRSSVLSITDDRRLQALLIAFSFGAFLEGAAGFGAPVAISAALLVGLGFNPLYAAGICLIANTAPVAFGAIGIPITAVEGPTGIPAMEISQMVGRQLPFLSVFIPLYLIIIMSGFRKALEIWPAILVSGVSFAVVQYLSSNFLGPELPDVLSALVSMAALAVFLKWWKPKTTFRFAGEQESAASIETARTNPAAPAYRGGQIFKAWSPFLLLTAMISVWGIPSVKSALTGHYEGSAVFLKWLNAVGEKLTFSPGVPFLNNQIVNADGTPIEAVYKLEVLGSAGTAILIAAVLSKFITAISWKDWGTVFKETVQELKLASDFDHCFCRWFCLCHQLLGNEHDTRDDTRADRFDVYLLFARSRLARRLHYRLGYFCQPAVRQPAESHRIISRHGPRSVCGRQLFRRCHRKNDFTAVDSGGVRRGRTRRKGVRSFPLYH